MRPPAWAALAVVALLACAAALVGAFTRFDGDAPPREGEPGFADYEAQQYDAARLSPLLGLVGAFAFLAGAACAQQAWRGRARP